MILFGKIFSIHCFYSGPENLSVMDPEGGGGQGVIVPFHLNTPLDSVQWGIRAGGTDPFHLKIPLNS